MPNEVDDMLPIFVQGVINLLGKCTADTFHLGKILYPGAGELLQTAKLFE